jgi:hypothetical protein
VVALLIPSAVAMVAPSPLLSVRSALITLLYLLSALSSLVALGGMRSAASLLVLSRVERFFVLLPPFFSFFPRLPHSTPLLLGDRVPPHLDVSLHVRGSRDRASG